MIIFNHPAFRSEFPEFLQIWRSIVDARCRRLAACSARNRRFIKPNKAESPKPVNSRFVIGAARIACPAIALWNCRESCQKETMKRGWK